MILNIFKKKKIKYKVKYVQSELDLTEEEFKEFTEHCNEFNTWEKVEEITII